MHRESCQENIVKHVYDSDEGYTLGASIEVTPETWSES